MPNQDQAGHRQRLKARFLSGDPGAQTDEALLELLLTYSQPQKDVLPLARRLLARFGSLGGVMAADVSALSKVEGVKEHTATLLRLAERLRAVPGPDHLPRPDLSLQPWLFQLDQGVNKEPQAQAAGLPEGAAKSTAEPASHEPELPVTLPESSHAPLPADAESEPESGDKSHPTEVMEATPVEATAEAAKPVRPARKPPQRPRTGLFSKAVFKETVQWLPRLPEADTLDEVRSFFEANLHYSGAQTRNRHAAYITRRMFPDGQIDRALPTFARQYAGRQELRDVCFYRFCRAEPLMADVVNEVLLPAVGRGVVEREQVRSYLVHRFGPAKSIRDTLWAIADVLGDSGLARVTRTEFSFAYREPLLPSLAFVLHEEFPAGMYAIEALQANPRVRALLWNPDRLLPALYELRNRGLVAKVSEIDSVRQFTTRWDLAGAVVELVGGAGLERH